MTISPKPDIQKPDIQKIARQFIEAIPHARELGMQLVALGDGRATITMPYDLRLVGDPAEAQATLSVSSEERSKSILSFDTGGRVREFQLRYRLGFRVHDAHGREYLPQSEIRLTRDISFNDAQVLSKESEELLLYRDMQSDMVQQILRRLSAAPPVPIAFEPGSKDAASR